MNVAIADGYNHSIGAVIDGTNSRALLFVDGEIAGLEEDIPECQFRPGVSACSIPCMHGVTHTIVTPGFMYKFSPNSLHIC